MNDPLGLRFVQEVARPFAERVRALKVDIDEARRLWDSQLSGIIGNDPQVPIEDGRADVNPITAADVAALVDVLYQLQTVLDQVGVAGIVSKPCVKMLVTR